MNLDNYLRNVCSCLYIYTFQYFDTFYLKNRSDISLIIVLSSVLWYIRSHNDSEVGNLLNESTRLHELNVTEHPLIHVYYNQQTYPEWDVEAESKEKY